MPTVDTLRKFDEKLLCMRMHKPIHKPFYRWIRHDSLTKIMFMFRIAKINKEKNGVKINRQRQYCEKLKNVLYKFLFTV